MNKCLNDRIVPICAALAIVFTSFAIHAMDQGETIELALKKPLLLPTEPEDAVLPTRADDLTPEELNKVERELAAHHEVLLKKVRASRNLPPPKEAMEDSNQKANAESSDDSKCWAECCVICCTSLCEAIAAQQHHEQRHCHGHH